MNVGFKVYPTGRSALRQKVRTRGSQLEARGGTAGDMKVDIWSENFGEGSKTADVCRLLCCVAVMGDQRAYVERDRLQKVDRIAGLRDISVDGGPSGTILHQLTWFSSRSTLLRPGGLKRKASKLANRCVQQT